MNGNVGCVALAGLVVILFLFESSNNLSNAVYAIVGWGIACVLMVLISSIKTVLVAKYTGRVADEGSEDDVSEDET